MTASSINAGLFRPARLLTLGLAATAALSLPARAQVSELGLAADYAGLELDLDVSNPSNAFTISSGNSYITGSVGIANGDLTFSGGGTITGEVDAGSDASVSVTGGSVVEGGVVQPYSSMSQVVTDAENAATYYTGLGSDPTQTFSSITTGTTITGDGGLDVITIGSGINLQGGAALTLSGDSSDNFVIDIESGGLTLGGGSDITLEGISPDQVVFNLIGTGVQMTTTGNSDTAGIFLAENGQIAISGGVQDSEFIAGDELTFHSGPTINEPVFAAVPELKPWEMAALAAALIAGLEGCSRLRQKGRA